MDVLLDLEGTTGALQQESDRHIKRLVFVREGTVIVVLDIASCELLIHLHVDEVTHEGGIEIL